MTFTVNWFKGEWDGDRAVLPDEEIVWVFIDAGRREPQALDYDGLKLVLSSLSYSFQETERPLPRWWWAELSYPDNEPDDL